MHTALLPPPELRLLGQAIGRHLARLEHDGFQVGLNCDPLRLSVVPVEVVVPHPHSQHLDVERIGVELRPPDWSCDPQALRTHLGVIAAIDVARTLVRFGPAERSPDTAILGVSIGPSTGIEATFCHPTASAFTPGGAAALALLDAGLRIRTAAGHTFWLAAQGFFIIPFVADALPEGWEGTIQYLSLSPSGTLAA
jgi:hypothetical protein